MSNIRVFGTHIVSLRSLRILIRRLGQFETPGLSPTLTGLYLEDGISELISLGAVLSQGRVLGIFTNGHPHRSELGDASCF
ncbi:hypothetical protein KFL_000070030 [Klebsormidium nitens]|uniref:Uncharacterized protein n=1 Tax=Klebsormidium nitens TaxID=105231 RepID=A0A1Y1HKA4_KLENI|nr:hypothetical protein KFL_000070030 [Klebsormidium nitens]|eukprot:GAQ78032.1 hypothetical protein KFL_000070030 [Klebsormidium nitens]